MDSHGAGDSVTITSQGLQGRRARVTLRPPTPDPSDRGSLQPSGGGGAGGLSSSWQQTAEAHAPPNPCPLKRPPPLPTPTSTPFQATLCCMSSQTHTCCRHEATEPVEAWQPETRPLTRGDQHPPLRERRYPDQARDPCAPAPGEDASREGFRPRSTEGRGTRGPTPTMFSAEPLPGAHSKAADTETQAPRPPLPGLRPPSQPHPPDLGSAGGLPARP